MIDTLFGASGPVVTQFGCCACPVGLPKDPDLQVCGICWMRIGIIARHTWAALLSGKHLQVNCTVQEAQHTGLVREKVRSRVLRRAHDVNRTACVHDDPQGG